MVEMVWQPVIRLVLAGVLSGLIGLERESHGRPAGLRTHILVSVGSALIMLTSIYGFPGTIGPRDPARLAAQVVSGIGFLGAGTILREGANIRGLTTAASLWVAAGIGLAAGSGYYIPAIATTAMAVATLVLLERFERKMVSSRTLVIEVRTKDRPGQLGSIAAALGRHNLNIRDVDIEFADTEGEENLSLLVEGRPAHTEEVVSELMAIGGVLKVRVRG